MAGIAEEKKGKERMMGPKKSLLETNQRQERKKRTKKTKTDTRTQGSPW